MRLMFQILVFLLLFQSSFAQSFKTENHKSRRVIIEGQVPPDYKGDFVEITRMPAFKIEYKSPETEVIKKKVVSGRVRWVINTDKTITVQGPFFGKQLMSYRVEPGDSISISYIGGKPVAKGKGSIKFELMFKLEEVMDSLEKTSDQKSLSHIKKGVTSTEDYLAWHLFLNKKLALSLPIVESYRKLLSPFVFNSVKEKLLYQIEQQRLFKFNTLVGGLDKEASKFTLEPVNDFGLTNRDLCNIYDSTMNGFASKWLQFEAPLVNDPYYLWWILRSEAKRQRGTFFNRGPDDSLYYSSAGVSFYSLLYNMAKQKYRGVLREEVLAFTFHYSRGVIHNEGFKPEVEELLKDYYSQKGYAEYKKAVKRYELERREKWNINYADKFTLIDQQGKLFDSEKLKNKIVVLDFWFTGCAGCIQMSDALRKIEHELKNDTNVVFVSVSIDTDKKKWQRSVLQKRFTTGSGIQLYTGGQGKNHKIVESYGVEGYPALFIIDPKGRFVSRQLREFDPRTNAGSRRLLDLIQVNLAYTKDGPYIFYEKDKIRTEYFPKRENISLESDPVNFYAQTDLNTTFKFQLKDSLTIEPALFSRPEKLFVLSDIEGNFDAFRKLLQANKIIDENFEWKFGNGHLVFAGDMFDRGQQVTECLWLVYSLEEKAKAAGGYVHFILGNHEIMNLQGDHRYAKSKYLNNAAEIGKKLIQLYTEDTELGKWLRTKNIVERIGDLLFMHGGVSAELNNIPVTIEEINELARPNYSNYQTKYADNRSSAIMSTSAGPFWYRGYYQNRRRVTVIDSTLKKFNVSRIITGHTVVADTISVHYGGKVINTDTRHARGKSEALLIEGDHYYRVNPAGERKMLFIDDRKKLP